MVYQVAVCGLRDCTREDEAVAYRVGQLLAERGAAVICGSWGTLSEVALAARRGTVPVISLGGWRVVDRDGHDVPGVEHVADPDEAVARAVGEGG